MTKQDFDKAAKADGFDFSTFLIEDKNVAYYIGDVSVPTYGGLPIIYYEKNEKIQKLKDEAALKILALLPDDE